MGQNVELEFDGKNKQRYGWKHLSIEKSDFCSLCLAMHCSKFPPQVPVETYRTEKKMLVNPQLLGKNLSPGLVEKTNKQMDESICPMRSLTFLVHIWLYIVKNFRPRSQQKHMDWKKLIWVNPWFLWKYSESYFEGKRD